jgi:FkbM family methyltransferase
MLPNCELVKVEESQFIVFKTDDVVTSGVKNGGYEPELHSVGMRLLQTHTSGTVLDIGANLGSFCVRLAKNNPALTFHAFEPQRIIYYQLCANTFINGLDNIHCHQFGLSNKTQRIELEMPDYNKEHNIGAFSIDEDTRDNDYECKTVGKKERVTVFSLDSAEHRNIVLIKLDVEGHELEVIRGAKKTLEKNNYPPIIFEAWTWKPWFEPKRIELIKLLEIMGYQVTEIGENNVAQNPKFGAPLKIEVV